MSECDIALAPFEDIEGTIARTLIQIVRDAPLMLEDFAGGPSASAEDNDAAMAALLATFDAVTTRGTVQFAEGHYNFSQAIAPPTFARNLTLAGHGSDRTILRQTNANQNGFTFPAGLNAQILLRDFLLQGAGSGTSYSGTGMGIYQPGVQGNDSFALEIDRIWVYNFGSDAISLGRFFNSEFNNVHVNFCGGDGIVAGGNTITARGCYIHRLPEAGAVAYKFISGTATLISCNGVDDGDVWGQFGTSTLDGDAEDAYCAVTLIGCNVEDFGTIGVDLRNGTITNLKTGYLGKLNTTDLIAMRMRSNLETGYLDNYASFALKQPSAEEDDAGEWSHDCPVHALGTNIPFSVIAGGSANKMPYWNVTGAAARTLSVIKTSAQATGADGLDTSHMKVTDQLWASGKMFMTALDNYANDAAAAAGGVAVGQFYRNGSILMVRAA